jgi:predicted transcriptional regulator
MLNKKEKVKLVLALYNQGKTYREIAQNVHMSLRDINSAIKEATERHDDAPQANIQQAPNVEEHPQPRLQHKSKQSQALKSFSKGKPPLDVAIELDLPPDEVRRVYHDYLRLEGLDQLVQVYQDRNYDLETILKLYRIIKQNKISHHEILEVVRHANELPDLQDKSQKLKEEIGTLQTTRNQLNDDRSSLHFQLFDLRKKKGVLRSEIKSIGSDATYMKSERIRLERIIDHKYTNEDYQKIEKWIKEKTSSYLSNNKRLLLAASLAACRALKEESTVHPQANFGHDNLNYKRVLKVTEQLYDTALRICTNETMEKLFRPQQN